MLRFPIATLVSTPQSEAWIAGFVEAIRTLKRMIFVVVRDRTGQVQVTIERAGQGDPPSILEEAALSLTVGTAVRVRGTVAVNPSVKSGGVELVASVIEIVGAGESSARDCAGRSGVASAVARKWRRRMVSRGRGIYLAPGPSGRGRRSRRRSARAIVLSKPSRPLFAALFNNPFRHLFQNCRESTYEFSTLG